MLWRITWATNNIVCRMTARGRPRHTLTRQSKGKGHKDTKCRLGGSRLVCMSMWFFSSALVTVTVLLRLLFFRLKWHYSLETFSNEKFLLGLAWAAGRASGMLNGEVLVWLSILSKVQMICIWSSWCQFNSLFSRTTWVSWLQKGGTSSGF